MSSPLALPASTVTIESELIFDFDCLIGITSTLFAISAIAVALRVYVRTKIIKSFGWDDGTMVVAMFFWTFATSLCIISTKAEKAIVQGIVTNVSDAALVQVRIFCCQIMLITLMSQAQLIRYTNAAYALTMIFVKISIGLFFLKLFTVNFKWQRVLVYALTGVSTVFGAVYLIMTFATCGIMVRSQETTPLHTGTDWCPIQDTFVDISIVWSVLNAITDLTFQALSIHILWNAKLNRATKVSASLLLVLGSIGGVASIARIVIQTPLKDIRMSGVLLGLWSNTEAGLCVTAASLMTLRPLFQTWLEKTKLTLASISARSNDSKDTASGDDIDLEKSLGDKVVLVTRSYEVKATESDGWSQSSHE